MFVIQYETVAGTHKMQDFKGRDRTCLAAHLAGFEKPIMAVYEQGTVITKAMRKSLAEWPGTKSRCALDFINSRQ